MKKYFKLLSLSVILFSTLFGATRVAYLRPGPMMKIPFTSVGQSPYLFTAGFGSELHNFSPFNTAGGAFISMETAGWTFGFSTAQGGDTTRLANLEVSTYRPPVEFGFHLQRRVFSKNNVSFSVGLQDIVFENNTDGFSLDTKELSFFGIISSQKAVGNYNTNMFIGFGTGGFGAIDTVQVDELSAPPTGTNAGVFAGAILNTPYLEKWGGVDIVGEFDGNGINVGLRIPLTSDYRLNLGFTHIEKLPQFKQRYWVGHPGFTVGLDMAVPRQDQRPGRGPSAPLDRLAPDGRPMDRMEPLYRDSTIAMADYAVLGMKDSMALMNNEMRNLVVRLSSMEQESQFLNDSLRSLKLESNVSEKNMNEALRHLSKSLRYFYAGDYREALKEVDMSLELNPNLALAYARRGSIYYKLGDVQRATINWNLALRLDPEYTDVRNILKALSENKMKSANY